MRISESYALDARLGMIESARSTIDLQYYLIADDSTGRLILRALRDAAQRGVRVRLLVDDLYTATGDRLLLGLAATPHIEVRLFNPFVTARASPGRRLLAMALDFKRLNHRMHNKLFIVDGAMAVVGGRNLADEYFLRGAHSNFIDFDVLLAGPVVTELSGWFDLYWNSFAVFPAEAIARTTGDALPPELARRLFDDATRADPRPETPSAPDLFGAPAFSTGLAERRLRFLSADIASYADSPRKIDPAHNSIAIDDSLSHRFLLELSDATSEVVLFSPYFLPGPEALERIGKLRDAGVRVRIVTNSLAVSDEPLVSVGTERHQIALLRRGAELYELSSNRLKLDHTLQSLFGSTTGRLHAKMSFIDHRYTLVGSMNLDPRSAQINTEVGVRIDSPEFAAMVRTGLKFDSYNGVYEVKLQPSGTGVYWVAADPEHPEQLEVDPDTSLLQRIRLLLLSFFIPESQL
ncbi:MAG: phospholipase D family protein [Pseudomonadota bacterium]|nr:phospholipase D family protein [Pseudomonadota bacterium]